MYVSPQAEEIVLRHRNSFWHAAHIIPDWKLKGQYIIISGLDLQTKIYSIQSNLGINIDGEEEPWLGHVTVAMCTHDRVKCQENKGDFQVCSRTFMLAKFEEKKRSFF